MTRVTLLARSRLGPLTVEADVERGTFLGRDALFFCVVLPGEALAGGFYELRVVEVEPGVWQVELIDAHRTDLRRRGIGPAVLKEAKRLTGGSVRSSSNITAHQVLDGERRTPDATRMWERLVRAGSATYDASTDRYTLT